MSSYQKNNQTRALRFQRRISISCSWNCSQSSWGACVEESKGLHPILVRKDYLRHRYLSIPFKQPSQRTTRPWRAFCCWSWAINYFIIHIIIVEIFHTNSTKWARHTIRDNTQRWCWGKIPFDQLFYYVKKFSTAKLRSRVRLFHFSHLKGKPLSLQLW